MPKAASCWKTVSSTPASGGSIPASISRSSRWMRAAPPSSPRARCSAGMSLRASPAARAPSPGARPPVRTAIFLQVKIGLLPLRGVARALARIRDGSAQSLEGDFPAEIAPLATELNSLIAHSAEVVARARTHVSNLAHFLKTPLSVLASEAEASPSSPLAEQVKRQVFTMRRQVDHYLTRAR